MPELQPWWRWVKRAAAAGAGGVFCSFCCRTHFVAILRWMLSELIQAQPAGIADRPRGLLRRGEGRSDRVCKLALLVGIGGFAKEAWWQEASLSAPSRPP